MKKQSQSLSISVELRREVVDGREQYNVMVPSDDAPFGKDQSVSTPAVLPDVVHDRVPRSTRLPPPTDDTERRSMRNLTLALAQMRRRGVRVVRTKVFDVWLSYTREELEVEAALGLRGRRVVSIAEWLNMLER